MAFLRRVFVWTHTWIATLGEAAEGVARDEDQHVAVHAVDGKWAARLAEHQLRAPVRVARLRVALQRKEMSDIPERLHCCTPVRGPLGLLSTSCGPQSGQPGCCSIGIVVFE